jgi:outer membrane protein insertion porin family
MALPALAADEPTPASQLQPDNVTTPLAQPSYDQAVTISQIRIDGTQLIDETTVRQAMRLQPGSIYNKETLQEDLKRIYELGYFTDQMKAIPIATQEGIVLNIRIEENVPVSGVTITGNTKLNDDDLASLFKDQTGLPQNVHQLNKAIEQIEAKYAEKGYVLARVTSIEDDPDGKVTLIVDEGMIDNVQFVGNRKTLDFVLERNMVTKAGQPYNEKALGDDLKRLYSLQAFDDVRRVISVSPDNPDHYNVVIEVDEKRSGALSLGGGFDTGTGFFGTVGYSDPNFLGRGENFNSAFGVGSGVIGRDNSQANARTYQFDVGWSTPAFLQTDNALSTNLFGRDFASFNVPLGIERRIGAGVSLARAFTSLPNASGSLGLRFENVAMREGTNTATLQSFGISAADRSRQLQDGTFLSLSPTLAYDTRDNVLNPESGWFNTVGTTGALGLGNDSYGTISANVRRYVKIKDGISLAFNGQVGTNVFGDIPEFNLYRLGGMFSVRGFQEGGLGSGAGYALGSAELRTKVPFLDTYTEKIPFLKSLRLVAFADAGSLLDPSDTNRFFTRDEEGYSVGLGIRVDLPGVGPIRIDYAIPLGSYNDEYLRRFNFGIGQKF